MSALTGTGLPELLQVLEDEVPHPDTLVSRIHSEGEVLSEEHLAEGTRMSARVGPALASELHEFLVA